MGFKIGIGGVVTFKNGTKLQEVVKELDMEDFLLETDSPYLTPEPFRGSKNEPYNVIYVAEKIAQIRQISINHMRESVGNYNKYYLCYELPYYRFQLKNDDCQ